MSITAYVGLPGHGKSYGVVANVIEPALKAKRVVYTNIPMNTDVCMERFEMSVVQFQTQDLIDNKNWFDEVFEKGAIIIIDELWRLWPSGLKANQALEQHKSFLAEHRHMVGESGHSTEIIFVTQDLSQIASFSRALVETTYRVEKLSKLGADKRFRVDVFSGSVTGSKPPMSRREREIQGSFKKDIYALYQSHTKSDVGAGIETRTDNRYNVLKGSAFKIVFFGLLLAIFLLYWLSNSFLTDNVYMGKPKVVDSQVTNSSNSVVKSGVPETIKPAVSNIPVPVAVPINDLDILSKSKKIYYLGSYSSDSSDKKNIIHQYKIILSDSFVVLTQYDLVNLDYNVRVVNDCLSIITGYKHVNYAMCKDPYRHDNGFIGDIVTSTN